MNWKYLPAIKFESIYSLSFYDNVYDTWPQLNNTDVNCLGKLEQLQHLKLGQCEELPAEF